MERTSSRRLGQVYRDVDMQKVVPTLYILHCAILLKFL